MAPRFYSETPVTDARVTLTGPEMHHLAHVFRARVGMEVTLFDGSGVEFACRVLSVGRSEIGLEVFESSEPQRELSVAITLGVALPKGDRQTWLVEKAVELGVKRLIPIRSDRSVALPSRQVSDRLRRTVLQASKQCGRNLLMEIGESISANELLTATQDGARRILAHPDPHAAHLTEFNWQPPIGEIVLAVGPEGGFTKEEVDMAQQCGWQTATLGPRKLRVETAALSIVAGIALLADSSRRVATPSGGET